MTRKIITTKFAKRLSYLIDKSSKNNIDVAEVVSLSPATISRYCNGAMSPKIPTVQKLAEYFNVNELWLMGCDVPMERENKVILDQNGITLVVSEHEEKVIMEYRNHPSAQPFVDKLLGIENSATLNKVQELPPLETTTPFVTIAAHKGRGAQKITYTPEQEAAAQEAKKNLVFPEKSGI